MASTRILIVEDGLSWRDDLHSILSCEEDIQVIGYAENKEEALTKCNKADLIILDDALNGDLQYSMQTAIELNHLKPSSVLFMTETTCRDTLLEAYSAGVVQCVLKSNIHRISHIVRSIMDNRFFINICRTDYIRLKRENLLLHLSPSEREIIELLEQGLNQSAIAQNLYKSQSTIKNQVGSILKKMNVRSTREAILLYNA